MVTVGFVMIFVSGCESDAQAASATGALACTLDQN